MGIIVNVEKALTYFKISIFILEINSGEVLILIMYTYLNLSKIIILSCGSLEGFTPMK